VRAAADVWVANFNAPGQVVIAGDPEAVAEATRIAKELGAKKVMPLPVNGAFHTPFMASARERLRKALSELEFRELDEPVVANVDARPHTDPADWPGLLSAQLCSPVRWRQTLHGLAQDGATTFVELGPGNALTGMAKRTVEGATTVSVSTPDALDTLLHIVGGQPASGIAHEGEHLFMVERMVVSPAAGVFLPTTSARSGGRIEVGEVLGVVAGEEVRSPFAGLLAGFLAVEGERVMPRQPIAWLRVA
jgi:[acyl-carrier-protein] S-malonyltransferase